MSTADWNSNLQHRKQLHKILLFTSEMSGHFPTMRTLLTSGTHTIPCYLYKLITVDAEFNLRCGSENRMSAFFFCLWQEKKGGSGALR